MKKFILLLLTVFLLTGCGTGGYVVKIGNDKIGRGEYMVYLKEQKKSFEQQGGTDIWQADFDGVSAEEVAKQNAVNSILMVKTAVKEAPSLNIEVTEEDKASIEEQTDSLMTEFTPEELEALDLDRDEIYSIMEEGVIQQKVYSYVTDSYVVNEEEFEEYLNHYYEENKSLFMDYRIKEIFLQADAAGTANADKIHAAYDKISKGADFDSVMSEVAPKGNKESFILDPSLYTEDTLDKIYALKKGQCTLAEDADGYHIFKVMDIKDKGNDLKEQIRADYINEKKQEIYQAQNDSWAGDTDVTRNDTVWNEIHIQ